MLKHVWIFAFISLLFNGIFCKVRQDLVQMALQQPVISVENYMFWPNATVPFYVNPDHFDHEQSLSILTTLSKFAFKTCLKFAPVMAPPASNEHVLVFENIGGVRRCVFETLGHSVFEPHRMTLGYDCLKSPHIELAIMRSLGFPFEHNRINRNVYINVLHENIEPGNMDLFTIETLMPFELRAIPYDVNSVMHFGPRDFSKNGHRTIMFKDPKVQQNRVGLTKSDLKKIDVIYGDECRGRDRQKKLELCQSYPGVARKKRDTNSDLTSNVESSRWKRDVGHEIDPSSKQPEIARKKRDVEATPGSEDVTKSLRINPNITPPPNVTDVKDTLTDLGIQEAVQNVVEEVNKVSALALKNARQKYCNNTKSNLRTEGVSQKNESDILGIIELIANYAQDMVDSAVANLTQFCEESQSMELYQRARCNWNDNGRECRQTYRSTKSGPVQHRTQHRPVYVQSTKHSRGDKKRQYDPMYRSGNNTDEATEQVTEPTRRKREVNDGVKEKNIGLEQDRDNKEKNENKQEKKDGQNKKGNEQDNMNEQEKGEVALRAGTTISQAIKRIRYEPVRRQARRNRARLSGKYGDTDDSSISIEMKKPIKKHSRKKTTEGRQQLKQNNDYITEEKDGDSNEQSREDTKQNGDSSAIEYTKKKREYPEKEDEWVTKKMKKVKDDREMEKKVEEVEYTTEKHKRKLKKEQKRREIVPRVVELSKKNKEFYGDRKWPRGLVTYVIQEDTTYDTDDLRRRLEEVNDILKQKTCVRLKGLTEDQAKSYEDYVVIDNSPDYVTGRVGGRQSFGSIELFRGDQHRQHTAMMVMAILGFYFEVSRHDRDKHVRVHMRHVRPDKLHHFEKIREDATLPLPYDYYSATHPAWQYWRQLGRSGISTVATFKHKDPDGSVMKSMGQNEKLLSDIDIVKINSVYGVKCFLNEKSKQNGEVKSKRKHRSQGQNKVTEAINT